MARACVSIDWLCYALLRHLVVGDCWVMGMLTLRMREWLLQLSFPFKGDPSSSGIRSLLLYMP